MKTSSRKNDLLCLVLLHVLVSCKVPESEYKLLLSFEQRDTLLEVSAALDPAPYREVLTSLSDGLEAEIQFQFRIYEKVDDLFSIFGDRLLIERHPTYRARMDFFENAYVITSSDGTTHETNGQASFIENFFQIDSYPLESFEPERGKRYYLRARIHLNHVKLEPPLNLIYLFHPIGVTTDWIEMPLRSTGQGGVS